GRGRGGGRPRRRVRSAAGGPIPRYGRDGCRLRGRAGGRGPPAPGARACATLRPVRWLVVLPFERPGLTGMDFADELRQLGHEVRTFEYRKDNPLYKNRATKAGYQSYILHSLERTCVKWRP